MFRFIHTLPDVPPLHYFQTPACMLKYLSDICAVRRKTKKAIRRAHWQNGSNKETSAATGEPSPSRAHPAEFGIRPGKFNRFALTSHAPSTIGLNVMRHDSQGRRWNRLVDTTKTERTMTGFAAICNNKNSYGDLGASQYISHVRSSSPLQKEKYTIRRSLLVIQV